MRRVISATVVKQLPDHSSITTSTMHRNRQNPYVFQVKDPLAARGINLSYEPFIATSVAEIAAIFRIAFGNDSHSKAKTRL